MIKIRIVEFCDCKNYYILDNDVYDVVDFFRFQYDKFQFILFIHSRLQQCKANFLNKNCKLKSNLNQEIINSNLNKNCHLRLHQSNKINRLFKYKFSQKL